MLKPYMASAPPSYNAPMPLPSSPQRASPLEAGLNAFGRGFQRHWLAILVGMLLTYSLLPFLAPILMKIGWTGPARILYTPYKFTCHTLAFRSFFLFGDQIAYSRGDNPSSGGEFQRLSGINPSSPAGLIEAREFLGNDEMGYKTALCQRDIAIYFVMALNGMAFALVRNRPRPIPWPVFVLIGIVPIALDGVSQLVSQPPLNLIAFRESTWQLRALTGGMFGFGLAWLVFPILQEGIFREEQARGAETRGGP